MPFTAAENVKNENTAAFFEGSINQFEGVP